MKLVLTTSFQKIVKKRCQKNPALRQVIEKQLQYFSKNPYHPSLKTHKLVGKRSNQFSVRITGDLRALCVVDGNTYIFF